MKYIWNAEGGLVPNIGQFNTGDEVSADVAQRLKDAGYTVQEVADAKPAKVKGEA
jgi:hypothetical protein